MASLTTTEGIKLFLGLKGNAEDSRLELLRAYAEAAIVEYLGRQVLSATHTEYYSGDGTRELRLRQYPVTAVQRVNIDYSGGYYGQQTGAFNPANDLVDGSDYAIVYDGQLADGTQASRRGILERVNGDVWPLYSRDNFGAGWYGGPFGMFGQPGKLAREVGKPRGGNILVVYTAGYSQDNLPADLSLAANLYVSMLRRTARFGGWNPQSEHLGQYDYSLSSPYTSGGGTLNAELGTIRQILNRYKEVIV